MKKIIENQIIEFLRSKGVEGEIKLSIPPAEMYADFAVPCFRMPGGALAVYKKIDPEFEKYTDQNKIQHLEGIAIFDSKFPLIAYCGVSGPFLNFRLNTGELAKLILEEMKNKKENFGSNEMGKGKSVMIEYPSNNTHKEFHIGHLRNLCIGNTLVGLYKKSGYEVVPVNYLNDFGSHVAKCLWGVLKLYGGKIPEENKQKWLGEVYAEASGAVKDNDEYKKEVSELQQKLEAKDPEIWPLFMETRQWSIDKFTELFEELGVEHKDVFFEKDIKEKGQNIVDELLAKGVATVGERGAIIIELSEYKLDIALVRKADGTGLYLTSDLPLAEEKFKKYDVDESIVITGIEQNFYFKQLYKILELLGTKKKLTHIGYGLVTRPEGKMSSRLGNVVLYEDLRDEVFEKLYRESEERHPDWDQNTLQETVQKLTQAALKFSLQKHEAGKNIVFDIKDATSFEGFTGPYILYVVARINSLLRKSTVGLDSPDFSLLTEIEEKKLLLLMAEYEGMIQKALENYNPSVITKYCFDLAQAFNEFYNKQDILKAETPALVQARLALSQAVKQTLTSALQILTIETVEEM